jgi:hypothetical protein
MVHLLALFLTFASAYAQDLPTELSAFAGRTGISDKGAPCTIQVDTGDRMVYFLEPSSEGQKSWGEFFYERAERTEHANRTEYRNLHLIVWDCGQPSGPLWPVQDTELVTVQGTRVHYSYAGGCPNEVPHAVSCDFSSAK